MNKAAWAISPEDMSMTWRTSYSHYVRSILEAGEVVPYSIHIKATQFACCELRAMIMDRIGEKEPKGKIENESIQPHRKG